MTGALKIWNGTGWVYAETGMGVLVQASAPSQPASGQLWLDTLDDTDPTMGGLVEDTGWHYVGGAGEPAFQNGWVNFDARTLRFRRLNGVVYLDGIVKSGTMGTTIFTLPAGYRPQARTTWDMYFPCNSNGAFGSFAVNGNGDVMAAYGSNAWIAFASSFIPGA